MVESQALLDRHLAVSPIFIMLERNVLRNIRLKTLKFSFAGDNKIKIDLSGIATNYDALSRQSDALGTDKLRKLISTPVVSDFSPLADGNISFNFTDSVNPDLVSYKNILGAPADVPADSTASSTTP